MKHTVLALLLALLALPAGAEQKRFEEMRTFTAYLENDFFGGSDRHYTNAVKFTATTRDLREYAPSLPDWALPAVRLLPAVGDEDRMYNLAFSLGQSIYTPSNTDTGDLVADDRPYAGWLYGAVALHCKNANVLDTFELDLGVVGPSAMGEQVQNNYHNLIGIDRSEGWKNQLHDEPGLLLTWERAWRALEADLGREFGLDLLPHAGIVLGNVADYLNLGGEVRLGFRLPTDFGASLIRPGAGVPAPMEPDDPRLSDAPRFGGYLFAGIDGRAVAHNIFLDGNTWQDSHHVTPKRLVADLSAGASVFYGGFSLTYTHVFRTPEFEEQRTKGQAFGSVSLAYTF